MSKKNQRYMTKEYTPKYSHEQAVELVDHCYTEGEPVFIIRAKDYISYKAVQKYAETLKNAAGPDNHGSPAYDLAEAADTVAAEMLKWQAHNQDKVKLPD